MNTKKSKVSAPADGLPKRNSSLTKKKSTIPKGITTDQNKVNPTKVFQATVDGQKAEIGHSVLFDQHNNTMDFSQTTGSVEKMYINGYGTQIVAKKPSGSVYGMEGQFRDKYTSGMVSSMNLSGNNVDTMQEEANKNRGSGELQHQIPKQQPNVAVMSTGSHDTTDVGNTTTAGANIQSNPNLYRPVANFSSGHFSTNPHPGGPPGRQANSIAKSALHHGGPTVTSPFDARATGKVKSPYAISQGHLVGNRGNYKTAASINQIDTPDHLMHQVKTKQVFFQQRRIARNIGSGDPSSPTNADQQKSTSRFVDYGKRKSKQRSNVSKKSKSNIMLQRQSASQANGLADRLTKSNKSQLKSNPQFIPEMDRFEKQNHPKLVYSQAGLTDNKNEYSNFISKLTGPKSTTNETINQEPQPRHEVLDPQDLKNKLGQIKLNVKLQEHDPLEFQNIKIIQNLSPGPTKGHHMFNAPTGNNVQQLGQDLLLISEATNIKAPHIDYTQFMPRKLNSNLNVGASGLRSQPMAGGSNPQNYKKSRLGANTLKSMIDQSNNNNNQNKSQDNLRDTNTRYTQNKTVAMKSAKDKQVPTSIFKTVGPQESKEQWEADIYKVNRSAHFADKLFQSVGEGPNNNYYNIKQINNIKADDSKYHQTTLVIKDERAAAEGMNQSRNQLLGQQYPQKSGSVRAKYSGNLTQPYQMILSQQQLPQHTIPSTFTQSKRVLSNDGGGPLDNYTYNLHMNEQQMLRHTINSSNPSNKHGTTQMTMSSFRTKANAGIKKGWAPGTKSNQNLMTNYQLMARKYNMDASLSPGSRTNVTIEGDMLSIAKHNSTKASDQRQLPPYENLQILNDINETSPMNMSKSSLQGVQKMHTEVPAGDHQMTLSKRGSHFSKQRTKGIKANKLFEGRAVASINIRNNKQSATKLVKQGFAKTKDVLGNKGQTLDEKLEDELQEESIKISAGHETIMYSEMFQPKGSIQRDSQVGSLRKGDEPSQQAAPNHYSNKSSGGNLEAQFYGGATSNNSNVRTSKIGLEPTRNYLSAEKRSQDSSPGYQQVKIKKKGFSTKESLIGGKKSSQSPSRRTKSMFKDKTPTKVSRPCHQTPSKMRGTNSKSKSPNKQTIAEKDDITDIIVDPEPLLHQDDSAQQLSQRVLNENMENTKLYDFIAKLDPCKLMEGGGGHFHEHVHAHKGEQLTEADLKQLQRDLISTNQLCQRLVTTQENQEPLLNLNTPTIIQVFGNSLPTVVRCRLDDMIPPIKIAYNYSLEGDMSGIDLGIFYSFTTKQPNRMNCVQKFMNKPKAIVIPAKDQHGRRLPQYENPIVYISMQSEVGCSLELTLKGTSKQMLKKLKLQQQSSATVSPVPEAVPVVDEYLRNRQMMNIIPKDDPYYQEMLAHQKMLETKAKERRQNKSAVCRHIFNHPFLKEYHKEQATKNRNKIIESNYAQNVQFLRKWDIYKQVKAICIRKKNYAQQKKDMVKLYILLIKLRKYMSYSSYIYKKHMQYVSWKERSTFISLCMWQAMRRKVKPLGKNILIRNTRLVQNCLKFPVYMYNESQFQNNAKQMVTSFLKYQTLSLGFAVKLELTLSRLLYIQRKFRIVQATMKQRRLSLRGPILERQAFLVNQQMLKQGKEELYKAIQDLTDKKKDFICDCIIMLAKFDFKQQFMDWYLENKVDQSTDEGQEKAKWLQKNIKAAHAMSLILIDWISQNRTLGRMHLCATRKKNKIAVDDYMKIEQGLELAGVEHDFKAQIRQKEKIKSTAKKIELTTKEYEEMKKKELEEEQEAEQEFQMPGEKERQQKIKEKVEAARQEQEAKAKMANLVKYFKKQNPIPKFMIFSRLDKDLLKALLVKCTELEDYELDDLKDLYFNQDRAEMEGALDAQLDGTHMHSHESSLDGTDKGSSSKKEKEGSSKNKKKKGAKAVKK